VDSNGGLRLIEQIGTVSENGFFVYRMRSQHFSYINAPLLNYFDFEDEPDSLEAFRERIIAEDQEYIASVCTRLLEMGVVEAVEFRVQSGDHQKTFAVSAYRIEDFILGVLRDLTKIREHENYIANFSAKKDAILEMVSHNLSGPLNISHQILTSLEKVISSYANTDVNKHLQLIRESMNHCIDVINDFLVEEHITSGHVSVRNRRFNVVEKVESTLDRLRKSFPEKEFNVSTLMDPLFLNSDEVKFFQVFHNLVLNAVKFTPEQGKIDVILDVKDSMFYLTVRDDGIGIPDALKGFIFQKYSPACRPGLKDERSIGMGLYIAKKLTMMMGGTINFNSVEKAGSTFTVQIPIE
jgi:two-component system, OmpR family, sensor histidine kinase VicK